MGKLRPENWRSVPQEVALNPLLGPCKDSHSQLGHTDWRPPLPGFWSCNLGVNPLSASWIMGLFPGHRTHPLTLSPPAPQCPYRGEQSCQSHGGWLGGHIGGDNLPPPHSSLCLSFSVWSPLIYCFLTPGTIHWPGHDPPTQLERDTGRMETEMGGTGEREEEGEEEGTVA